MVGSSPRRAGRAFFASSVSDPAERPRTIETVEHLAEYVPVNYDPASVSDDTLEELCSPPIHAGEEENPRIGVEDQAIIR